MNSDALLKREVRLVITPIRSITVASESIPSGLRVGALLTVEHGGHRIEYRITNLGYLGSSEWDKSTKIDLEIAKIYY